MKNLNFLLILKPKNKRTIKRLLFLLAKMTKEILYGKDDAVKILALRLNKDIDVLNQKLSFKKYNAQYIQITKGLKDISDLLGSISFEMSFHKIHCNTILKTLVIDLEKTFIMLSNLTVSGKQTPTALTAKTKQIIVKAIKEIRLAKIDASNETNNFIENLKCSSIYDKMEFCFLAADDINKAIFEINYH
ncbi:MAG: hypothetical protein L6420_03370 [Elusimicrobia bacterium]|nr:hypothetical protein [Elusimicrobiota bacterium]